jgi:hypothetical protein
MLLSVEEPKFGERESCDPLNREAIEEVDGCITVNETSTKRKRCKTYVGRSTDDNDAESVSENATVGDSSSSNFSSND